MKLSADVTAFAARLGHRFEQPDLLQRALTHASISSPTRPDNQRLEFLGDRVLGLVMAEALLKADPARDRGQAGPTLQRAGAQGNLRRGGARPGSGRCPASGPVRDAVGRAPQSRPAGRRDRGGDRRRLPRWRVRGGANGDPDRLGATASTRSTTTPATPRPRCRNGRRRWARPRRSIPKSPAKARITRRCSPFEARLATGETAQGQAAAKRHAEQAAAKALLDRMEAKDD